MIPIYACNVHMVHLLKLFLVKKDIKWNTLITQIKEIVHYAMDVPKIYNTNVKKVHVIEIHIVQNVYH